MKVWALRLGAAARWWWKRKHANEAAALAFYSLFSLIPMLICSLYVASWIVDEDTAMSSLLAQTSKVTGFNVKSYFGKILTQDITWVGSSYSPIISTVLLAVSATKVITELRRAFGKVFGAPRHQSKSHAALANIIGKMTSLFLLIMLGLAIASAVIFETILSVIRQSFVDQPFFLKLTTLISPVASLLAITFLTAIVMRILPSRPPKLREAIAGGIVCALLLTLLKYALTLFLLHANIANMFGGAMTMVLLLLWIYFVMQVILYAAELVAILASERRSREGISAIASPNGQDQPSPTR